MKTQDAQLFRPWMVLSLSLLATALLGSWLHPAGRSVWNELDEATFRLLNGSLTTLQDVPGWTAMWAFTNIRLFDVVAMILMTSFMWTPGVTFPKAEIPAGTVRFVVLLLFLLAVREGFHEVVNSYAWNRPGPSLVYEPCVRLSELFPSLRTKDFSNDSFPGDHAAVAMLWAGFTLTTIRNRWTPLVILATVFLMLPRLVGGAHSVSDDLVGGGFVTSLTLAFVVGTPLLRMVSDRVYAWVEPLIERVLRMWPLNVRNVADSTSAEPCRHDNPATEHEQRPAA
ncbi:MAG: phosphatase PAP2 family protein [Fuerstiella sp.]|nr:phosphatase PAP2 family protein [Fuerstiella sp.]MCP4858556.1 phosphatase PAP2 family protein [Fuerstiella sp.]